MKDSKRDFIPFSLYDRTGIAAHMEQRAAQGWLLDRVSPWGWHYRRIQPKRLHFAVTYYPKNSQYAPTPSEEQLTFQDFCAHTGWELAAALENWYAAYLTEWRAVSKESTLRRTQQLICRYADTLRLNSRKEL